MVYVGGFELYGPEGLYETARLAQVAYGEVVEGPARLGAKKRVAGDLDLAHRVAFYAVGRLVLRHV